MSEPTIVNYDPDSIDIPDINNFFVHVSKLHERGHYTNASMKQMDKTHNEAPRVLHEKELSNKYLTQFCHEYNQLKAGEEVLSPEGRNPLRDHFIQEIFSGKDEKSTDLPYGYGVDPMSQVQNVKHKIQCADLFETSKIFIRTVDKVFRAGALKHGAYSWENNPHRSDATVDNNISAMLRHFWAIRHGIELDEDGISHWDHLACRAAMMMVANMRPSNGSKIKIKCPIRYLDGENLGEFSLIPVELPIAMGAYENLWWQKASLELEEYSSLLVNIVVNGYQKGISYIFDPEKNLSDIDKLFFQTVDFVLPWLIYEESMTTTASREKFEQLIRSIKKSTVK